MFTYQIKYHMILHIKLILQSVYFIFLLHHKACRILVPQPGMERAPPAVEVWNLNHWTAREVPTKCFYVVAIFIKLIETRQNIAMYNI